MFLKLLHAKDFKQHIILYYNFIMHASIRLLSYHIVSAFHKKINFTRKSLGEILNYTWSLSRGNLHISQNLLNGSISHLYNYILYITVAQRRMLTFFLFFFLALAELRLIMVTMKWSCAYRNGLVNSSQNGCELAKTSIDCKYIRYLRNLVK